ncbi:MAG: DUF973 family protein [Anaeroplasmataceae bacterium]
MKNFFDDKYELLKIEKLCYYLFIYASIIFIITTNEVKSFYDQNKKPDKNIRNEYVFSSIIILIVFVIFMIRNYNNIKKLNKNDKEYENALIRLIGSIFIVIGQIMVVYYFYQTTNFE